MSVRNEDKRKSVRVPVQFEIRLLKEGREYSAIALNLSNDGMFIKTSHMHQPNDPVDLRIQLPGEEHLLRIKAKVVWSTWIEGCNIPTSGMGLQFEELTSKQKEELNRYIDRILES